jgi:ABC-2 type transport system ATP-binding protein
MNVIEINNLTKYYGDNLGIEDVSFNVKEGEILGFIGPNGAGKSTTIRLLLGLIFPTSGDATIFGEDCIESGPTIREEIGYLPSEVFYYDKMKVIDLLKYSASFYKKDCDNRIYKLAEIMELDLNRKIEDLSYGNKKKVGIVQCLLHSPKLLLLDEPTTGLDPLMQQKFFKLLEEERKNGTTVLFSSHILAEVQQVCDRVAIIKEGKIIKFEDIKELQKDNYKKITLKGNVNKNHFKVDGVTELNETSEGIFFYYKGDMNHLIDLIGKNELQDVRIEEPTLEEVFIHYYK